MTTPKTPPTLVTTTIVAKGPKTISHKEMGIAMIGTPTPENDVMYDAYLHSLQVEAENDAANVLQKLIDL